MEADITIVCPGCKRKFQQKTTHMRPGMSQQCPSCRRTIKFKGDDIQRKLDTFERKARDLFKGIKIGKR